MAFFSKNSADYASQIQNLVKPTYTSKYGTMIEDSLNKILNKEKFSYDFNADPLYQNYKDMYSKQGKEAGINATASAAGNTGGLGNSYGVTAGTQANQEAVSQLYDRIPELYSAAQTQYQNELNNMYNKHNVLTSEENRLYGMYRDQVSDYYSDWSNLLSGFGAAQNQENADRAFAYQQARDAIEDARYTASQSYTASRAAVADSQWQRNYALALKKAQG